jgi:hypothetical protein
MLTLSYRDAIARANLAAFAAHAEAVQDGDEICNAIEAAGVVKAVSNLTHNDTRTEQRATTCCAVVTATEYSVTPVTHLGLIVSD